MNHLGKRLLILLFGITCHIQWSYAQVAPISSDRMKGMVNNLNRLSQSADSVHSRHIQKAKKLGLKASGNILTSYIGLGG